MIFLSLFFSVQAQAADVTVTSENIKDLLIAKNAKVAASRHRTEAAKEKEGYLVRSFLPSLEAYGAQENFKVGQGTSKSQPLQGIEAKINVFNGGRDSLESEVRNLEAEKRDFQAQKVLSEELEKARAGYWEIRALQEKISLLKETLDVNEQQLSGAQRRVKSGVATETDRFEFEMKSVDLRREIAETEIKLTQEKRLLALRLGLEAAETLQFPEKWSHDHEYEALLKHSPRDHQFLWKEHALQSEQQSLSAQGQRRTWWPKLDVYAASRQYNEREKDFANAADRTESVVGIRVSMSLAAGFESQREAAALEKEALASQRLMQEQQREVEIHLQGELDELKLLHEQVHAAEENIARAERYHKLTLTEYSRGVKNSPDVLGASEKLYDMKSKRLEITRDFQLAKVHLLSKIGR